MNADTLRAWAPIIALVLSLIAIIVSLYTYAQNKKKDVMPVLVFSRRSATNWQVENVGNGPALNVVLGDGKEDGTWAIIAKLYPIAAGARVDLPWLDYGARLGTSYADVWGEKYATMCEDDINEFSQTRFFSNIAINRREWELQ